ncbi:hypothetical protein OG607_19665 [Streptomyces sp. NBC_01537]|uniref:hypothetical protein n=1 Tax=Streptomyces sp. NBC_01537 TaxID=2903896 RepID=UPI003867E5EC
MPTNPTPPETPPTNGTNPHTNTGSGNQIHISTHASTAPASSPSSSAPARAAALGTLFSGTAALILAAATLLGLTGGAALQAKTNVLPLGNPAPTVTATATVTTTATTTATVTATPAANNAEAVATDTAGTTTSGTLATTNDGWLVFYRGTETVGYSGMNFGVKPPTSNSGGAEFRIGGTDGGDPYIEPVYDHTIVRLTKAGTIGPKTCKSEATSHPSQYKIMPIQVGYSYCLYLQTGGNGNLAVLLTTQEVTNKSLENSTARFSVTIWSEPGE